MQQTKTDWMALLALAPAFTVYPTAKLYFASCGIHISFRVTLCVVKMTLEV